MKNWQNYSIIMRFMMYREITISHFQVNSGYNEIKSN